MLYCQGAEWYAKPIQMLIFQMPIEYILFKLNFIHKLDVMELFATDPSSKPNFPKFPGTKHLDKNINSNERISVQHQAL